MAELNFRLEELRPYAEYFESQEELERYEMLLEYGKEKQELLDTIPDLRVFEDIVDKQKGGFTYIVPRLDDPRALMAGKVVGTCFKLDDGGERKLREIFTGQDFSNRLMIVLDENKNFTAYCRYRYKKGDEEIWVGFIGENWVPPELDSVKIYIENDKAIRRGLFDQMNMNNKFGKNPVKYVNSRDPKLYMKAKQISKKLRRTRKIGVLSEQVVKQT